MSHSNPETHDEVASQNTYETHGTFAPSPLRILVETFWDIQSARIRAENRIRAYRQRYGVEYPEAEFVFSLMRSMEKRARERIEKRMEEHPAWDWVSQVKGAGRLLVSQAIGLIGDIGRFPNISKLWKYSGMHVIEGKAPKRRRYGKVEWNPRLRSVFWKIGRNLLMAKASYYEAYQLFRRKEEEKNLTPKEVPIEDTAGFLLVEDVGSFKAGTMIRKTEKTGKKGKGGNYERFGKEVRKLGKEKVKVKMTDLHIHMRALRKTIKLFIAHLWTEWRKAEGLPITMPYAKTILGHKDYIHPFRDK